MKEKYFLCLVKWNAKTRREDVTAKSKGYATVEELLKAAAPWIAQNLGKKFFIQKYCA